MMKLLRVIPLSVLLFLVSCGNSSPVDPPASTPPDSPATTTDPAAPESADAAAATGTPSAPVEESAGDEAGESLGLRLAAAEPEPETSAGAQQWRFREGRHFTELTAAQGTSSPPDKIEVAEVFWYGCPHCFNFDPYIARWQQGMADDVNFIRLPVMWNPTNQIHARAFYTAEALGKLDVLHEAMFRAIHEKNNTLTREAEIRDLFERFGVSTEDFDSTFRSFAIDSKLKRARSLTERYRIRSVPVLIVNGKYIASGPDVKTFDDMLNVADELIARERAGS